MYKRLELHNHTTESDASITCRELVEYMVSDHADAFAITDHNTISGHRKIRKLLAEEHFPIQCIYGMEYTTYYGHILCLNLEEYVPWEDINIHHPELLFQAARAKGALVGIAHPYSFGHPFARGCRFDMKVTDYSCVDFIEIFNNPEPLHEVNERGLQLWEDLVLSGEKLAMTCGMDLHGKWSMANQYATFIEGEPEGDISRELTEAIKNQKTCISRGPVLSGNISEGKLTFTLTETGKPGYQHDSRLPYLVSVRSAGHTITKPLGETFLMEEFDQDPVLIPKLFEGDTSLENLICVGSALCR
ncbi:MAG: PHP domain-containing protein [Clostridiales bacterium]|nr:PHP domain-containing protein [Clostridiales bacterium]